MYREMLQIKSKGRAFIDITAEVNQTIAQANIVQSLCHLFVMHTSASMIICENADPDVRVDLANYMERLVIDGDPHFKHILEGKDDMAAHIRTVLTQTELTLPVEDGRLMLGTWQGIYLWEHRYQGHNRKIIITIY